MPERHSKLLWTEIALWVATGLCLITCVLVFGESSWAGIVSKEMFLPEGRSGAMEAAPKLPTASSVLGRMEIPALRIVVPITVGVDPMSLTRGVGHISGTALPGGLGTVGLAGHRDTFLRGLRRVVRGMDIKLVDASGVYHYTVEEIEIVTPDDVRVLDIGPKPELALITCYPFDFVGSAPRRFVVHASLQSVSPDKQS